MIYFQTEETMDTHPTLKDLPFNTLLTTPTIVDPVSPTGDLMKATGDQMKATGAQTNCTVVPIKITAVGVMVDPSSAEVEEVTRPLTIALIRRESNILSVE